jgi:hypothetical protein
MHAKIVQNHVVMTMILKTLKILNSYINQTGGKKILKQIKYYVIVG